MVINICVSFYAHQRSERLTKRSVSFNKSCHQWKLIHMADPAQSILLRNQVVSTIASVEKDKAVISYVKSTLLLLLNNMQVEYEEHVPELRVESTNQRLKMRLHLLAASNSSAEATAQSKLNKKSNNLAAKIKSF